jgi:hypothetical protein
MLRYNTGARELAEYYSRPVPDIEKIRRKIGGYCGRHADESPCTKKSFIHEIIAGECPVVLFPHFPFFWEVSVGRNRCDWGLSSPLSTYLKESSAANWIEPYQREVQK